MAITSVVILWWVDAAQSVLVVKDCICRDMMSVKGASL
jgi:hypothetical protein